MTTIAEARHLATWLIERSVALQAPIFAVFSFALHAELLLQTGMMGGDSLPKDDGIEYWGESDGKPWRVGLIGRP